MCMLFVCFFLTCRNVRTTQTKRWRWLWSTMSWLRRIHQICLLWSRETKWWKDVEAEQRHAYCWWDSFMQSTSNIQRSWRTRLKLFKNFFWKLTGQNYWKRSTASKISSCSRHTFPLLFEEDLLSGHTFNGVVMECSFIFFFFSLICSTHRHRSIHSLSAHSIALWFPPDWQKRNTNRKWPEEFWSLLLPSFPPICLFLLFSSYLWEWEQAQKLKNVGVLFYLYPDIWYCTCTETTMWSLCVCFWFLK